MQKSVSPRALPLGFRRILRPALAFFLRACERRRQRLYLSELDDRLLADVGLTREDVTEERAKPFWR